VVITRPLPFHASFAMRLQVACCSAWSLSAVAQMPGRASRPALFLA
jgi:hypothetical protein